MSVDSDLDVLKTLALTASTGFHDELRDAVLPMLKRAATAGYGFSAADELLNDFEKPLTDLFADAKLASWLTGAGQLAGQLRGAIPTRQASLSWVGSEPWRQWLEEPLAKLESTGLLSPDQWTSIYDLYRQVASRHAHERLAATKDRLRAAVAAATGKESAAGIDAAVTDSLDTSPVGPGLLENAVHGNVYSGYGGGQDYIAGHPDVPDDQWPYVINLGIPDSRQTDLCYEIDHAGLDGTPVYNYSDPVWRHYRPIRHYNCRCAPRMLTIAEAADRGVREAQRWLETGVPPAPRQFVAWPVNQLPPGWVPGGGVY